MHVVPVAMTPMHSRYARQQIGDKTDRFFKGNFSECDQSVWWTNAAVLFSLHVNIRIRRKQIMIRLTADRSGRFQRQKCPLVCRCHCSSMGRQKQEGILVGTLILRTWPLHCKDTYFFFQFCIFLRLAALSLCAAQFSLTDPDSTTRYTYYL